MEDVTLALITLTSFVLLFVVAIFADRAGASHEHVVQSGPIAEPVQLPTAPPAATRAHEHSDADVA